MKNNPLAKLSIQQLKRALEIKQDIENQEKELGQLLSDERPAANPAQRSGQRKKSAAVGARISVAQKARWAKCKQTATPGNVAPKKKGTISPEGRARIIAGTKARWARYNAEKKKKAAA